MQHEAEQQRLCRGKRLHDVNRTYFDALAASARGGLGGAVLPHAAPGNGYPKFSFGGVPCNVTVWSQLTSDKSFAYGLARGGALQEAWLTKLEVAAIGRATNWDKLIVLPLDVTDAKGNLPLNASALGG